MQFVAIDLDQLVLTCTFDMWNGGKHSHEMAYKSKKLNFMMGKNLEPNLVVCSLSDFSSSICSRSSLSALSDGRVGKVR